MTVRSALVHGIVFHSFRDFTAKQLSAHHEAVWRDAGEYAADRAYPDEAFGALLARTSVASKLSEAEVLRRFGAFAAQETFVSLHPDYYSGSPGTRIFLLHVEERIHELVRSALPGAAPPRLRVVPLGTGDVMISYTSERGLCALLEGLVHGTAAYYGEEVSTEQVQCLHRGDLACAFVVHVRGGSTSAPHSA